MRVAILLIIVLISTECSIAQSAIPSALRAEWVFNSITDANGLGKNEMLIGVPLPPGDVIGDTYLDSKWNRSKLLMYENEKVIEGFPIKYNIKGESLEIKTRNGIKVLEARRVKVLVWVDSLSNEGRFFVNGKEFKRDGAPLSGFLEVLSDGNMPLLKKTTIVQKDPNYVPAFDVGSRDTKILKKEVLYFAKEKELTKISGKKSLLQAFGEHSSAVEQYIKDNKLEIKDQDHLAKVFEFYNSKTKPQTN